MGIFSRKKEGGLMDTIRCDERDFLIWKWRPYGGANTTSKENSIRFGSSLRVKANEIAVFVYNQEQGKNYDFIQGPYDEILKTDNLPIITEIIGLAYAGKSPFQAEVYFINLAGNIQLKFGIPYFDVFDPRFLDFGVPMSVRGTMTFNIDDHEKFLELNRLLNFEIDDLKKQIKDAVGKHLKDIITNLPEKKNMPVLQIERHILEINELATANITNRLLEDFGINVKGLDIGAIEADKDSQGYRELKQVTIEQVSKTVEAQTDVNIKDLSDKQRISAEDLEESLQIQREELQRIQKLKTEGENLTVHQLNQQADVAKTAAESLGKMGGGADGSGGGMMDAGSMMAGMAMGGAVGSGMASAIGGMMQGMNQTPPPPPSSSYHIANNGQQKGPFSTEQLKQLVATGELTPDTHVWKQGMSDWQLASQVEEFRNILGSIPPPPPMNKP